MNTEKYCQVFIHHVILTTKHLIGNGLSFQHDNDANHTADAVTAHMNRKTHTGSHGLASPEPQTQHY